MRDLLNGLIEQGKQRFKFKELPKFPSVIRDISFTVSGEVKTGQIDKVLNGSGKVLKGYKIFDYYNVGGKKSFAYTLEFNDEEKTLNDDEVNKLQEKIVQNLNKKLGAELRK